MLIDDCNLVEEILRQWKGPPGTLKSIAKRTGLPRERASLALQKLQRDGLAIARKGRWNHAMTPGLMQGVLQTTASGIAFVCIDDGQPDVRILRGHKKGAMHGDTVQVRIDPGGYDQREGRVVKVTERRHRTIAGELRSEGPGWRMIPRSARLTELYIPKRGPGDFDVQDGDLVLAEIKRYPSENEPATAAILRRLGRSGDPRAELLAIAHNHAFRDVFPEGIEEIPDRVTEQELAGRIDYRDDFAMTIDGATAQDFDDAVGLTVLPDGYRLYVHIADVSHYVKPGSIVESEAYERATSLYLPGLTLPMLPEALSNGICSLRPDADRLCFTAVMEFDARGERRSYDLHRSVIRSRRRMTYEDCNRLLGGDEALAAAMPDVMEQLTSMRALSALLRAGRERDGGIDLELGESAIELNDDLTVSDVHADQRGVSERIIEDFMIAANQAVAHFLRTHGLPGAYRVHAAPQREKLLAFATFAEGFNITVRVSKGGEITPRALQEALAAAQEPERTILARELLRSLARAEYLPEPLGHYGLGARDYCHFTSPIRRYPDLLVHRALAAHLYRDDGALGRLSRKLEESCRQSSQRERMAMDAEREADDYRKAEFMARYVGETYPCIITGMSRWGVYVMLPNTCEGVLPLSSLDDDFYEYDEERRRMTGSHKRKTLRMGDVLECTVDTVSLAERRVYLKPRADQSS